MKSENNYKCHLVSDFTPKHLAFLGLWSFIFSGGGNVKPDFCALTSGNMYLPPVYGAASEPVNYLNIKTETTSVTQLSCSCTFATQDNLPLALRLFLSRSFFPPTPRLPQHLPPHLLPMVSFFYSILPSHGRRCSWRKHSLFSLTPTHSLPISIPAAYEVLAMEATSLFLTDDKAAHLHPFLGQNTAWKIYRVPYIEADRPRNVT